ncbi:patatin-like phospholipase family protein [Aquimarina pacifica]|uniref:patatin-like phospholipase family protein n=1 Tax=Aquimarina pacifica TaxID=1296415 RepID=UPI000472F1CC|nr:patatin-like phospholipase family protein [Aquimarina pacifica]
MEISKNIGLVLSGGGFKGVAHIGAIRAIEEAGIKPTHISGTSAGAIVGALYAGGYSTQTIKDFFYSTTIFKLNKFTRKKPGVLDSEKFAEDLATFFPENTFEALQKQLYITATNLVEGTRKIFSSGSLINPIIASAAFPGIFSPVMINNELYADGGILDNFPVSPLIKNCDLIIGIDVSPIKKPKITDFKHSYNVIQRAYYLRTMPNSESLFNHCNIIVQPTVLANYGIFSSTKLDEVFDIGYQEAKKQLEIYKKQERS